MINIPKCEVCGKNLKNPNSKSHINSKYHQDALKKKKSSKSKAKPKKKKKVSSSSSSSSASFAWAPIRRLMKFQGAQIVAKDAVDLLIDHLQNKVMEVTEKSLKFTKHANRKKITRGDLLLALKYQ